MRRSTTPCGCARTSDACLIVPTLRVGTQPVTLGVTEADAERPVRRSHAERGNDRNHPVRSR
ncbi:hypothetical protein D3880_12875 [Pseudomonas cavernae]|uniref:Uncharacterized protein n=1 Tax=Pseudomonas cavernae TaxID=2320867 RepID=A0A385Z277_9PSED|nr:hypothetical protein D3880_12875 [Pseudomonas cavernae]